MARGHALECRAVRRGSRATTTCRRPGRILLLRRRPRARAFASTPASRPAPRSRSTTTRCWPRSSPGARDRDESIERMAAALERTAVLGVVTNLGRLRAILAHPAFRAGRPPHRLPRRAPGRRSRLAAARPPEAVAAALAALHRERRPAASGGRRPRRRTPGRASGPGGSGKGRRVIRLLCGGERDRSRPRGDGGRREGDGGRPGFRLRRGSRRARHLRAAERRQRGHVPLRPRGRRDPPVLEGRGVSPRRGRRGTPRGPDGITGAAASRRRCRAR